ncbi:hypothetical protein OMW55_10650 [Sphingomonas sp. BN140010]|uniref:Uncharacterized protein n=1 Tax=Sphingomonas arvum TaxID=2992113 RepID=A0ABT3JGQ8_9SPHN|nr:hypothetical protein [Sphingomonas sp. BN140010]MCW3798260.1 hypothetical protein [Sphingomonas sp. BN140010]
MVYVIALLLWIAPAVLLGLALLWVCFGPGRKSQKADAEGGAEGAAAAAPRANAVPG